MSPFFDTNVLLYAVRPEGPRAERARLLIAEGGLISVQALNEFTNVARRKLGQPWREINEKLGAVRALCEVKPLTVATHERALALAERCGYQIYDALQLASALENGCNVLYTEDLQDGQQIEGLTIRNPF
ncbi:MAG TPA: PIN domain-containing protein [Bryobacteraceae bacterium]|jgi:predicted nucleic acid-binding protein